MVSFGFFQEEKQHQAFDLQDLQIVNQNLENLKKKLSGKTVFDSITVELLHSQVEVLEMLNVPASCVLVSKRHS